MTKVLLVEDDDDLRAATAQSLSLEGLDVLTADRAAEALKTVTGRFEGVVVTDIRMPGMDGLELLDTLIARDAETPVILISGHADVPVAVQALKRGAYDVLQKPFAVDQLVASIQRAAERRTLILENRRLRETASSLDAESPLLGSSPSMEHLRRTIAQLGPVPVDVLIQGETGTGKAMVASLLHRASRRRGEMVTIDCGALPSGLFENEVFGRVSAPAPGSHTPRTGRIEKAHRGTLFLDEIEAMEESVQLKMQRVLESREVLPIGGSVARTLDLRVISASGADLEALAQAGRFRPSLFYRINGVTLRLPPLRERREDIVPLFRAFAIRAAERFSVAAPSLDARTFRHLERHGWPGNVRELMRFAENFVLGLIERDPTALPDPASGLLKPRVDKFEAHLIEEALVAADGDVTRACSALGLPRKTFYYKVQRLGIDLTRFRG